MIAWVIISISFSLSLESNVYTCRHQIHTMHAQLELEISLHMLFLFVFFPDAPLSQELTGEEIASHFPQQFSVLNKICTHI